MYPLIAGAAVDGCCCKAQTKTTVYVLQLSLLESQLDDKLVWRTRHSIHALAQCDARRMGRSVIRSDPD